MQKKLLRPPNAPPILPPIAEGPQLPQSMPAIGSAFPRTAGWQQSGDSIPVDQHECSAVTQALESRRLPCTLCT